SLGGARSPQEPRSPILRLVTQPSPRSPQLPGSAWLQVALHAWLTASQRGLSPTTKRDGAPGDVERARAQGQPVVARQWRRSRQWRGDRRDWRAEEPVPDFPHREQYRGHQRVHHEQATTRPVAFPLPLLLTHDLVPPWDDESSR